MPSALAVSYNALCDPTSGAAVSLRELLAILREHGWSAAALCGPTFERRGHARPLPLPQLLALGYRPVLAPPLRGRNDHTIARYDDGGVATTQLLPHVGANHEPTRAHVEAFGALLDRQIARTRPDVIITYGGKMIGRVIQEVARRRSIPVVFWLRNAAYHVAELFHGVAGVLVNSRFVQDHYARTLGIATTVLPSPVRWERVAVDDATHQPRALTFMTPTVSKGLAFAARIFEQVLARRPDLPILVVEGRGRAADLFELGAAIPRSAITIMEATTDPRVFYAQTRVLVAPSMTQETFLRAGVEAMINGIPTVASNRGGIPETLTGAGIVLDIPARYTERRRELPTVAEVSSWVDAILAHWDDATYAAARARCLVAREAFRWPAVANRYAAYFAQFAATRRFAVPCLVSDRDATGMERETMSSSSQPRSCSLAEP